MRILFLTDNFPPEGNAPATRTYEHASRWVTAGHDVTVLTCAPNFPEGKLFEGYKNRWYQREDMNGINVVRLKTYITANEGFIKRILDYMSFMITSFFAGLFQKDPDVIIATSPQFFTAISGWALSAVRRKPFIFELRDIWPASITAVGAMRRSKAIFFLEKVEMFLYRRADLIIAVTHSFKAELVQRGITAEKIHVILNGVDLVRYSPVKFKNVLLASKFNLQDKFVAGYIGTHGMAHGLEHIVEAAHLLEGREDIRIVFAGGGAARERLENYVRLNELRNVVLIPRQPKHAMPQLWSLCDVSMVNLRDAPLFRTVIPSKIFESMGMGIPMVVSMPAGEATEIVRSSKSGIVVPPESPADLANALVKLADNPILRRQLGENASKKAKLFSRDKLARDMVEVLAEAIR